LWLRNKRGVKPNENKKCKVIYTPTSLLLQGFTLAEILITLVIIGVIVAATIPTLINNTQKKEFVAGLKKANSTLTQAVYKIGLSKGYPVGDYSFFNELDFADVFQIFFVML